MKISLPFNSKLVFCAVLFSLLIACSAPPSGPAQSDQTAGLTPPAESVSETSSDPTDPAIPAFGVPVPTPAATPFPDIYGCEMKMEFTSGPLKGKDSKFTVLDEDYFYDKGDQFYPGENSAVYYSGPKYLILHSAFENGNVLQPLEAEFIRYYLEYWGESGPDYIQEQIDALIGSKMVWTCNDQPLFRTRVKEIIRLSAAASDELWTDPIYLRQILIRHEGVVSEWVGDMDPFFMDTFYLGFCGWGPERLDDARYTYYRYLINFDFLEN